MISLFEYLTEAKSQSFTLTAVGDALCHKSIYQYFKTKDGYDFTPLFSKYNLNKDNLNYINIESLIGGKELGFAGPIIKMVNYTRQEHFNAPKEFADAIVGHGFNLISLANNHTLDGDENGVLNTLKYWSKQPVIYAGSYKNQKERFEKHVYEKNGIKYAFFAYTMKYNAKENFKDHSYYRNDWDEELVKQDIESVKKEVDLIIVSMHWGTESTFTPNPDQIKAANFLAQLGVDIVLGMHSHCIQPVQYIGKTLVVYSLGNFIAQQLHNPTNTRIGLELNLKITKSDKIIIKPNFRLLYMYYTEDYKDFKIIPFNHLTDKELPNKEVLRKAYSDVVNKYKVFRNI